MKTHQPKLMFGQRLLQGISAGLKSITLLAFVFTCTTGFAQSGSFSVPLTQEDIESGTIEVTLKTEKGNITNYQPQNFTIQVNDRTQQVAIKSLIIKGDYMLVSIDASNISTDDVTVEPINGGGNYGSGGKLSLYGTLKEITIDNVSGVIQNDDAGSASVVVVDIKSVSANHGGDGISGAFASPNVGSDNGGNNTGGTRETDIITKDEVQGFVKAYPNPARGSVKINTTHSKLTIVEVTMLSAIGSKVMTQRPDDMDGKLMTIDTQNIPAGIYFLAIKTNMGDAVKRIVVVD
ncbi:MAG: T9SS type A sorting domain-containing protein [Sphingobacteriales bacterium JAD_PAG50586_3]|nr:MAG: T9SS type A sorting domain-containing protein [Sphingobacteriales bacterium JAD_PAG50586_3]